MKIRKLKKRYYFKKKSKIKMIKCIPYVEKDDLLYWISKDQILKNFDLNDLYKNRGSKNNKEQILLSKLKNKFSIYCFPLMESSYFHSKKSKWIINKKIFKVSVVDVYKSKTLFIGTRHRLITLMKHMDKLPLAFTNTEDSKNFIKKLNLTPIAPNQKIEIPDFAVLPEKKLKQFKRRKKVPIQKNIQIIVNGKTLCSS